MKKNKLLFLLVPLIVLLCCGVILAIVLYGNGNDGETQTEQTEDLSKDDKEEQSTENGSGENESSSEASTEHTHAYGEWTVAKDATCTEKGSEKRVCACGEEDDREIEIKAHTEETISGKDATCAETGLTEGKKCSVCGAVLVEQTEIPMKNEHTEEILSGKDATCTETGLTEGKKCSVCGEILLVQEEIEATGIHTFKNLKCIFCDFELTPSEGLEFKLNEDGESYSVTGIGTCTDNDVVIPYTYNDKPVTAIDHFAFDGCPQLVSITIPDSVTSIGQEAFSNCRNLTSITIGSGVNKIWNRAFEWCDSLTEVHINDIASWCNIAYSDLEAHPFYYADDLYLNGTLVTDLVIPDGVTSIADNAFNGYNKLTSVTIPDSVTSIGKYAFYSCDGLTSITIGSNVTSISDNAFNGCNGLTSITVSETNPVYHSEGDCLIETESKTLVLGCNNSIIPADGSVTSIGDSAFEYYSEITSITIPNCITSIDETAFSYCEGLTSVTIPNSVTSIGKGAFSNCTGLTDINFNGTKDEWDAILKLSKWNSNTGSYTVHCIDGDIAKY